MAQVLQEGRLYVLELQQRSRRLASRTLAFAGDAEAVAQARMILTGLPSGPDPVAVGVGRAGEAEGDVQWLGAWALQQGIAQWRVTRQRH